MNRIHAVAAVCLALALAACDGSSSSGPEARPTPGAVDLTLEAPNAADGALLIHLTGGPAPDSVVALRAGTTAHVRATGADGARIAVFGAVRPGALVRIYVADTRDWSAYRAVVAEAADASNALRPSLTGYAIRLAR